MPTHLANLLGRFAAQPAQPVNPPPAQTQPPVPAQQQPQAPQQAEFISKSEVGTLLKALEAGDEDVLHKALNLVGTRAHEAAVVDSDTLYKDTYKKQQQQTDHESKLQAQTDELLSALVAEVGYEDTPTNREFVGAMLQSKLEGGAADLKTAVDSVQAGLQQFIPASSALNPEVQKQKEEDEAHERFVQREQALDEFWAPAPVAAADTGETAPEGDAVEPSPAAPQ